MESKEAIQQKEEHIRQLVRALPDHKRLMFFRKTEKKLKDADTYEYFTEHLSILEQILIQKLISILLRNAY